MYVYGFTVPYFVVIKYQFLVNHIMNLLKFLRVASQALGQSYDYPSACEVTLKDMVKMHNTWNNKTQHSRNSVHNIQDIL